MIKMIKDHRSLTVNVMRAGKVTPASKGTH